MKLSTEVTAEKLRGGFYTPAPLVRHTLTRVTALAGALAGAGTAGLDVLEPSSGDGAFIAGLAHCGLSVRNLTAIEVLESEAAASRARLASSGLPGQVLCDSTLNWALHSTQTFDIVVGNLPFVRFQFVEPAMGADALRHGAELGVDVGGVSNLWLPMLLASLRHLRVGGAFAIVLPAECFTGVSAGHARRWILEQTDGLRCDIFPPGSYPAVLQEIVVLSGRRAEPRKTGCRTVTFAHHRTGVGPFALDDSAARIDTHLIDTGPASWTSLFLTARQRQAVEEFSQRPAVRPLGQVARLGVAAVTGANAFFSLTAQAVAANGLQPWSRSLLPRTRHVRGLRHTQQDQDALALSGAPGYLFDAGRSPLDPQTVPGAAAWLASGVGAGLDTRYKCRIRTPWYAIPQIRHGELLLSKRSHRFPRLIHNRSDAVTTDTIYCGQVVDPQLTAPALVAGFLNSGTLLSAELEGRAFGGGVLELVPSEVARLAVPAIPGLDVELDRLDALARTIDADGGDGEALVRETDLMLTTADPGFTSDLMETLASARCVLRERRLARSRP